MQNILVKSTNNHYTDSNVIVKDEKIATKEDFIVKHIEHEPISVDAGNYALGRVVECDPNEKTIRRIAD